MMFIWMADPVAPQNMNFLENYISFVFEFILVIYERIWGCDYSFLLHSRTFYYTLFQAKHDENWIC